MKKTYIKPTTTSFALNVQSNLLAGSIDSNSGNFTITEAEDDNTGITGWSRGNSLWDDEE